MTGPLYPGETLVATDRHGFEYEADWFRTVEAVALGDIDPPVALWAEAPDGTRRDMLAELEDAVAWTLEETLLTARHVAAERAMLRVI